MWLTGQMGRGQVLAGTSVRQSADRGYYRAAKLTVLAALLAVGAAAVAARGAAFTGLLLLGTVVLVVRVAWRRKLGADAYRRGAAAEERIGRRLATLESRPGWTVEHDVLKAGGGNLDHVVHGGGKTFVIDTKASRWRPKDLAQAHRHIRWAVGRYGRYRDYVPVICVERSEAEPFVEDGVCIVGAPALVGFLIESG